MAAPYAVTSASFLLSFSATGGLFLLSPILLRWITDRLPLCLAPVFGNLSYSGSNIQRRTCHTAIVDCFFRRNQSDCSNIKRHGGALISSHSVQRFSCFNRHSGFVRRRRKTQLVLPWAFSGGNRPACETAVCLFGGAQPFCFFLSSFICGRSPSFLASQAEHAFLYKAVRRAASLASDDAAASGLFTGCCLHCFFFLFCTGYGHRAGVIRRILW